MTATQQPQMIIEAGGNFLSGRNTDPCRGQFDSQGDAVHPANDRLNRSSDILAQLEPWLHVTGSIGKKPGPIRRPCFTGVTALVHRQRGHWPYQLPRDVKWRTARGQNRHGRTPAQYHLGHTRAASRTCSQQSSTSRDVASRRYSTAACSGERLDPPLTDSSTALSTRPGVGQRSKLNQIDLRPTQVTGAEAELQGQAGLTDTADANQGDKSPSLPE